ncbi:MAG: Flp pilus assembly complex ATPase component TadA [Candidatus Methanomethyliales bacterium]|nr:Flp pilus assembly complex ATPase component TadA [Candidatus Methanomethylicales archaeon]
MDTEDVIADLSAIKSGFIADLVSGGKVTGRVIISEGTLSAIRRESERGDILGLEELIKLKAAADQVGLKIEIEREERRGEDIEEAVLRMAFSGNYTLVTSNENFAKIAETMGLRVIAGRTKLQRPPLFSKYFSRDVMSVHLKEGLVPRGKVGRPGRWKLEDLGGEPLERGELDKIVQDILERAESGEGFVEIKREGSNIVMLKDSRVIITFPPFSDKLEVTITRKVAEPEIEDYKLSQRLINRFKERAEGILIAGAPGMGKTTFAQALAKFYLRENKIIKTIESPRDLHLPPTATQYSKTKSSSEELHDVLLLSRPDYTFFDEMRDTEDFKIFTDLRLAGVGMVGVIHATTPIDAIQRFIGRVELGVIPSVIDTVVFINNGEVEKVYELETRVKIPHGLTESDLTRPVVQVKNFDTGEVEFEIYVFGERTFVVPLKGKERSKDYVTNSMINRILGKYVPLEDVKIESSDGEVIIGVPSQLMNTVVKRARKKLLKLEEKLGKRITIKPIF